MSYDLSLTPTGASTRPSARLIYCPIGNKPRPKYVAGMVLWYMPLPHPNTAYPARITGGPMQTGQGFSYYVVARYLGGVLGPVSEAELFDSQEEAGNVFVRQPFRVVAVCKPIPTALQRTVLEEWAQKTIKRPEAFYQSIEVFSGDDRAAWNKRRMMDAMAKKGQVVQKNEVGFRPFIRGGNPWLQSHQNTN